MWTSLGNREKSEPLGNFSVLLYRECKCILYLATMYIYYIYSAMSKIKENAIFSKASRKKCHSNSLWWWPLWSTHLYCYCFLLNMKNYILVSDCIQQKYILVSDYITKLYLGQWLYITKVYLGQWLFITKLYLGQWLFITKVYPVSVIWLLK